MRPKDTDLFSWAIGTSRNFAKAKNEAKPLASLKKLLQTVKVTPETRKQFDKKSKDEQDVLKSINGWISGAQCSGEWRNKKNILPRDLATIDIDYAPASLPGEIEFGVLGISQFYFLAHSSRRHSPDDPRIRIFIPMSRKVSVDEYTAIIRYIGWLLDPEMALVDPVSYRPAQMMFLPTCSVDDRKHFFFFENDGDLFDVDAALEAIDAKFGDWRDQANLPRGTTERDFRLAADKAEDPRTKRGPVGDFCRAYDVESAIAKFLPDVYIPGDEHSGHPRYTYAGSTSSNGAVVYDNGLFMYSHHGHDPICDMNVNAFDLVRIHLFGDKDEKVKEGTGPKDMPSFKEMIEFISDDAEYRRSQASSRYDTTAMFDDAGIEPELEEEDEDVGQEDADLDLDDLVARWVGDGSGEAPAADDDAPRPEEPKRAQASTQRKKRKAPKDWFPDALELNQNGDIAPNLHNVATIIQYDPRMGGKIAYNAFTNQIVAIDDITSRIDTVPEFRCDDKVNGARWQDFNDDTIRAIIEAPNGPGKPGYSLKVAARDLQSGVMLAARRNMIHPIREYLDGVEWDGKPRVDTLFVRFLNTPDTPYHRQIARLMLVASVARVYEPGCKFDYACIIGGKQGIGKSTFVKVLHGEAWFGEIHCDLSDKQAVAEEIAGKWGLELPEMSGFHKADHNAAKAFMRRQRDDVRMAYGRHVSEFPRQCVFWGTTNDEAYLKDPTGNRSYWPVVTMVSFINLNGLASERDQLWAEAVAIYREMRQQQPSGDLPLTLTGKEVIAEAQRYQEEARTREPFEEIAEELEDWLDRPITLQAFLTEFGEVDAKFPEEGEEDPDRVWVRRVVFTERQAKLAILGSDKPTVNAAAAGVWQKSIRKLVGWRQTKTRVRGHQQKWWVREDVYRLDWAAAKRGYEVVGDETEAEGQSYI